MAVIEVGVSVARRPMSHGATSHGSTECRSSFMIKFLDVPVCFPPNAGCIRNLGRPNTDLREVAVEALEWPESHRPQVPFGRGGLCGRTEILPSILDTPPNAMTMANETETWYNSSCYTSL